MVTDIERVRGWLAELGHIRVYHKISDKTRLGKEDGYSIVTDWEVAWLGMTEEEVRELAILLLIEYEEEWIDGVVGLKTVGELVAWITMVEGGGLCGS